MLGGAKVLIMKFRAPRTDKRLLGTWRTDRRRTVAEWHFAKRLAPRRRRKFLAIFGKLRLTYTPTRIRGVYGDYRYIQRYEVLATDSDTVAIRYEDKQVTGQWRIQHIHFEKGDHYWIALGGNREWFKRIPTKSPNQAGAGNGAVMHSSHTGRRRTRRA